MRIGANTDRQAIAAVPRMSPLKKYIGSAENEKCAMEKHIAEKSTAENEPNARKCEKQEQKLPRLHCRNEHRCAQLSAFYEIVQNAWEYENDKLYDRNQEKNIVV